MTGNAERPAAAAEAELTRILMRARRRIVAYGAAHGALYTGATAGGAALALFAADRLTLFPGPLRLAASAIFVGGMATLLYTRVAATLLHPADALAAANALERRFPSLGDFAASAAELAVTPGTKSSAPSAELVGLTVEEALRRVREVPTEDVVERRSALRPFAPFAAALLCWAAAGMLFPDDVGAFLRRFANPLASVAYPARTRIVSVTAPAVMPLGDDFGAEALVEGVLPAEAAFFVTPAGGAARRIVAAGEKGRYRLALERVRGDFVFRVEAGDAVSREHAVRVVPRPAVSGLSAEVEYPAYTALGTVTLSGGNIRGLEGSRAALAARFNKAVVEAALALEGAGERERVAGALSQDGLSAVFAIDIASDARYRVALLDEHGFAAEEVPVYTITATADAPPAVVLQRPNRDLTVVSDATVPLELSAADDYGLSAIELCWTVTRGGSSGQEQRMPVASPAGVRSAAVASPWPLAGLALEPGDEVAFYVEAADSLPSAPQPGRSEARRLTVVTVSEKLAEIDQMNRRLQAGLRGIERKQQETRDAVEQAVFLGGDASAAQP